MRSIARPQKQQHVTHAESQYAPHEHTCQSIRLLPAEWDFHHNSSTASVFFNELIADGGFIAPAAVPVHSKRITASVREKAASLWAFVFRSLAPALAFIKCAGSRQPRNVFTVRYATGATGEGGAFAGNGVALQIHIQPHTVAQRGTLTSPLRRGEEGDTSGAPLNHTPWRTDVLRSFSSQN